MGGVEREECAPFAGRAQGVGARRIEGLHDLEVGLHLHGLCKALFRQRLVGLARRLVVLERLFEVVVVGLRFFLELGRDRRQRGFRVFPELCRDRADQHARSLEVHFRRGRERGLEMLRALEYLRSRGRHLGRRVLGCRRNAGSSHVPLQRAERLRRGGVHRVLLDDVAVLVDGGGHCRRRSSGAARILERRELAAGVFLRSSEGVDLPGGDLALSHGGRLGGGGDRHMVPRARRRQWRARRARELRRDPGAAGRFGGVERMRRHEEVFPGEDVRVLAAVVLVHLDVDAVGSLAERRSLGLSPDLLQGDGHASGGRCGRAGRWGRWGRRRLARAARVVLLVVRHVGSFAQIGRNLI